MRVGASSDGAVHDGFFVEPPASCSTCGSKGKGGMDETTRNETSRSRAVARYMPRYTVHTTQHVLNNLFVREVTDRRIHDVIWHDTLSDTATV